MPIADFTILERSAGDGPLFVDRCSITGDTAYPAGGSVDFQVAYRAAVGSARAIVALIDDEINDDDGSTSSDGVVLQYDHSADKLRVVLGKTMVESAQSDQSGVTYLFSILSK